MKFDMKPVYVFITILLSGLFVGYLLGNGNFFGQLLFGFLTIFMIVVFLILLLLSPFWKSITDVKYGAGIISLTMSISLVAGMITKNMIISNKKVKALEIISYLEGYQLQNGNYPSKIKYGSKVYRYQVSTDSASYEIGFDLDGWHYCYYDTENKEWLVRD